MFLTMVAFIVFRSHRVVGHRLIVELMSQLLDGVAFVLCRVVESDVLVLLRLVDVFFILGVLV